MTETGVAISALLIDIECELRRMHLWQEEMPAAEALQSIQPFSIDTLSLPQWLQFVFIPKIKQTVELSDMLPVKCEITPIAEEYFRGIDLPAGSLITILEQIDRLITEADV